MKFTLRNGPGDHNLTRVSARSAKALIKHAKAALESSPEGFVTVYRTKPRSPWNSFYICGKRDESQGFSEIEDFFKIARLLDGHPALEDWVWTLHQLPANERLAAVQKYVKGGYMLTKEEIERGLTDADWHVRCTFAERTDYTPTKEQIERGLTDNHWYVREAFAERTSVTLTKEQVIRGLEDDDEDVCSAFVKRIIAKEDLC